jgi:hypothetical protein
MEKDILKTKREGEKTYVFDPIRKKYVVLTAEEWVRQQLLVHLITVKKYPSTLLSVEKQLLVGTRKRRYDIVVYKFDKPWLIIECKRDTEILNDNVLQQILSYNSALSVSFLVVCNGNELFCYDTKQQSWHTQLPNYDT